MEYYLSQLPIQCPGARQLYIRRCELDEIIQNIVADGLAELDAIDGYTFQGGQYAHTANSKDYWAAKAGYYEKIQALHDAEEEQEFVMNALRRCRRCPGEDNNCPIVAR